MHYLKPRSLQWVHELNTYINFNYHASSTQRVVCNIVNTFLVGRSHHKKVSYGCRYKYYAGARTIICYRSRTYPRLVRSSLEVKQPVCALSHSAFCRRPGLFLGVPLMTESKHCMLNDSRGRCHSILRSPSNLL